MNILIKSVVLGSLLFLSGCAHQYGSYSRHSNGVFGISVDARIPVRSYPRRYRKEVYPQRPVYRDHSYSRHDSHHYDKRYHDSKRSHRRQHYADRKHNRHYSDHRYDNHHQGHSSHNSNHRREKGRNNYWDGKRSRYETYNHR